MATTVADHLLQRLREWDVHKVFGVLDVYTDPDMPPIPPHATFEQVKSMVGAVAKGDENAWGIIKEGVKTKAQELLS